MRYGFWLPVFLLLSTTSSLVAQTYKIEISEGKLDPGGLPLTGATMCLEGPLKSCYKMPELKNDSATYQFGLEPHAKPLPQAQSETWFLFDAMFSGGGSGTLTRYAILRIEDGNLVNLLPEVSLTNAGEQTIWINPKLSPYPIFVTADFDWDMVAGETHFARHHFFVSVWLLDPKRTLYTKVLTYRTAKKYDSLDNTDTISVITPEHAEILRRLASMNPKP
jgi:hypothetical protein